MKHNWLSLHGSVATLICLGVVCSNLYLKSASIRRRLQSEEVVETTDVEQQIMIEASNVSVLFSAIFFFFLGCLIVSQHIQADMHLLQRAIMKKRLEYSMFVCLYICFFSCLFNCIQYAPQDDHVMEHVRSRDTAVLDIGRPIEWILTCPLMQVILPILGGERVPDWRRTTMPLNSVVVLIFGLLASLQTHLPFKLAFYFCGISCFGVLCHQMNRVIVESTCGAENLLWGRSIIRQLVVIVVLTWIPFPIWYALSPEGFNVISNSAAMKISVAFLNVLSKGLFIFYLMRVRADLETKESVLAEIKVTEDNTGGKKENAYNVDGEEIEKTKMSAPLAVVIHDVLRAMGREADLEPLKNLLENNMITSKEDLMVLTPEYCESVSIPYGFVTACKQRIKQQRVQNADTWRPVQAVKTLVGGEDEKLNRVGDVAPLPPQVANDPRKLQEHQRRHSRRFDDDALSQVSGPVSPRSASPAPTYPRQAASAGWENSTQNNELQAAIDASQTLLLNELREMKRAQIAESTRIQGLEQKVNADLNGVHEQLSGMVNTVMDAIDSRLIPASSRSPRPISAPSPGASIN
jgi:bacteriorhodopsin